MLLVFYMLCVLLAGIGFYGQLIGLAVWLTKWIKINWLRNTLTILLMIIFLAVLGICIISYLIVLMACSTGSGKKK